MVKVKIDKSKCIGCGVCVNVCPEGFVMADGKAEVKDENAACVDQAALACPVQAIILNNKKEDNNNSLDSGVASDQGFGPGRGPGRGRGMGFGQGRGLGGGLGRGMGRGRF